jgi:hypothetical protein
LPKKWQNLSRAKKEKKKRILAITKKLRLKGRIPHAFERPVDPRKLRAEGGRMAHALERPVDPRKLRVKGAICIFGKTQLT